MHSSQVQCNSAVFLEWVGCREHEFHSKEAFKMCKIILIIVYYLSLVQHNFIYIVIFKLFDILMVHKRLHFFYYLFLLLSKLYFD